jgi:hypothetical protein
MKISVLKSVLLLTTVALLASCKKKDGNNGGSPEPNPNPTPTPEVILGTFSGNLQVTDDPQTTLGYVYNTKVKVVYTGNNATVKVTGNDGLDREYTGTITTSGGSNAFIDIKRQTKPVDKIAGTSIAIMGNQLTITINLANDNVVVRPNPTATNTINISGKVQMIGTNLLRE